MSYRRVNKKRKKEDGHKKKKIVIDDTNLDGYFLSLFLSVAIYFRYEIVLSRFPRVPIALKL